MIKTINQLRCHNNPNQRLTGNHCAVTKAGNQKNRKKNLAEQFYDTGNDRYDPGSHALQRISQNLYFQKRYEEKCTKAQIICSVLQDSLVT